MAESRIVDTRYGTGGVPSTAVPAGGSITFTATGVDDIPVKGALSVAESVAALNPTKNGFLIGQGHIHPRQDFTVTARTTSATGRSLSITCRPRLDSTFAGRRSS